MTAIRWREVTVLLLTIVLCLQEQEGSASCDEESELVLPLDTEREFVCSAPGGGEYDIKWSVNACLVENAIAHFPEFLNISHLEFSNGTQQKTLKFTAATQVNNTHLNCIVVNITTVTDPSTILMFNMTITIQGLLASPNTVNYELSMDRHSARFCWSAPFSLNISDTEPDILHYTVYIVSDSASSENVTTIDTHYVLHADPCQSHVYRVEIAAVNIVGEGEKYVSPEIPVNGYAVVVIQNSRFLFENGLPVIELDVETSPSCQDQVVYQVKLNSIRSSTTSWVNYTVESGEQVLKMTTPDIKENEQYNIDVSIEGVSGSSSVLENLSTHHIQGVMISGPSDQGIVNVSCYFAEGSQMDRCIIIATPQSGGSGTCTFSATKNEAMVTLQLPKGTYVLQVYDIDDKDTKAENPANTTTIDITTSEVEECNGVAATQEFTVSLFGACVVLAIMIQQGCW